MDIPAEFCYGMTGGALAELLGLWKLRQTAHNQLPDYLKSVFYWVVTLSMVAAGGIVALAYAESGMSLTPILAVNVGASAPLIIGNLTASEPPNITQ